MNQGPNEVTAAGLPRTLALDDVVVPTDTEPPTAPASLTLSAGRRRITLNWTPSTDNVGVAGYEIWRGTSATGVFTQIATTTSTSYVNSGLVSGQTYFYYVKAYDAAGNVSAPSATQSATPR